MGWTIPLSSMLWWFTQKMCASWRRNQNNWKMSFITIWRALWGASNACKDMVVWILLTKIVWRHQRIYSDMWPMPKTWQYQFKRCHATHQQSSDWALWLLGDWLHGSISAVNEIWVYPNGSGLCLQVGRSHAMQEWWQHAFKKDFWRNNISKIQSSKDSDKWQRFSLHRQTLRAIHVETWDTSQHRYSLSSSDKWSSRDIKQAN